VSTGHRLIGPGSGTGVGVGTGTGTGTGVGPSSVAGRKTGGQHVVHMQRSKLHVATLTQRWALSMEDRQQPACHETWSKQRRSTLPALLPAF
jgi:hypothetical protein